MNIWGLLSSPALRSTGCPEVVVSMQVKPCGTSSPCERMMTATSVMGSLGRAGRCCWFSSSSGREASVRPATTK